MRRVTIAAFCAVLASGPVSVAAFEYTPANIRTSYHEAPASFEVDAMGQVSGVTVGGTTFTQSSVANDLNVRLQRFCIGSAFWYVSDRGVIWADSDLEALSMYVSGASSDNE